MMGMRLVGDIVRRSRSCRIPVGGLIETILQRNLIRLGNGLEWTLDNVHQYFVHTSILPNLCGPGLRLNYFWYSVFTGVSHTDPRSQKPFLGQNLGQQHVVVGQVLGY